MQRNFSFIIPVYNRPEEIEELLQSFLLLESDQNYEIVIVEDGSTQTCKDIVHNYREQLSISYYFTKNSGPGDSRNFGMKKAQGNYFIILDSDCILPPNYLSVVTQFLNKTYVDCFGGADAAHQDFSNLQKAINYVMTSFLTTGGIRGSKKGVQKFEPRSFNMGLSKEAFEATQGFSNIHPGEDPDLSQRILKAGFETVFIPKAYVYHKRRVSWQKFYQQVRKFGMVRPILNRWHPSSAKITFWFPSAFIFFTLFSILFGLILSKLFVLPLLFYVLIVFLDASFKNRNPLIGLMSVVALFIQFFGYGWAFLNSTWQVAVLKKNPQEAYPSLFFE